LITGAGGSIGSELAKQICALRPRQLILLDRYENGLYATENNIKPRLNGTLTCLIADITDRRRVNSIFAECKPQIVFHAAAHKHVPLMEDNACEAVNKVVADAAIAHNSDAFVLISTDKAVNPSSVMGATKRVAELIVLGMAQTAGLTRLIAVRFGNVLGSNGSVLPTFMEQIRQGGPVTVTHPDIRRYFMLIPEAVQLVLHAAAIGTSGRLYVLDMGEDMKVLDVAKNLIRLSGFAPEQDIPITFTGLRPGEKLTEELLSANEVAQPSKIKEIWEVRSDRHIDMQALKIKLGELEVLAQQESASRIIAALQDIVPGYHPNVPTETKAVSAAKAG
jgi:FlaA1/EpsC-like NDP-sugar epimerase